MCFTPQQIFESARRGEYADSDPSLCGCRGCGWFLSNVDTWHQCPCHYKGQPDPESQDGLGSKDWESYSTFVRSEVSEQADEEGTYEVGTWRVAITQKATGKRFVHIATFEARRDAEKLMVRVAKSGRPFSHLDPDLWAEDVR